jgi:hypothetical protein
MLAESSSQLAQYLPVGLLFVVAVGFARPAHAWCEGAD